MDDVDRRWSNLLKVGERASERARERVERAREREGVRTSERERERERKRGGGFMPTRWATNLSSKVNLHLATILRALYSENLVT